MNSKEKQEKLSPEERLALLEDLTERQDKHIKRLYIITVILAIAIILLFLFRCQCGGHKTIGGLLNPDKTFTTDIDENAGTKVDPDKQAEIDRLNAKLEEGYMTFSINKTPSFENGTADGYLNIINLEENRYPQVVEIYELITTVNENGEEEDITGDLWYESKLIPVGKSVEYAPLLVDLDAGEYKALAIIHSVNQSTGESIGAVQTPLTITILH